MRNGSYHYAVQMTVPRGKRNGALEMRIQEDTIMGFLTMFTVKLPITQGSLQGNRIPLWRTDEDPFEYICL